MYEEEELWENEEGLEGLYASKVGANSDSLDKVTRPTDFLEV